MERFFKSGPGWRLGWNAITESGAQGAIAPIYHGLVGSDEWAIELTGDEFRDFSRLAIQLKNTMIQMETELMDQEKITCVAETDLLWLEADGYPQSYSLHIILQQGRRGEGSWSPEAVSELLQALETLTIF
ncbi:DUF1818 family protein [Gloeocapsa sp. PCC 73106]|uniref:DUF1818 family protein n=1 Tax=Gloeocapsa sp. PCC 73106 TaxID=102232 RepID=UPI0002AC8A3C|nr:DUF1818 family protein [Gloeocapsa sp. PCC 73106]ELR97393.1 protein of unknown function (DUF1818) [Gloeocapsa sp. PCC 73106]